MMARNLQKMNERLDNIQKKFPNVETKAVVCDFSKQSTIEQYREIINSEV
jgi:short-subunit dehydrogenase